ncbi:MAG TPA: hypothetical protein IAB56_04310 [Candidatus Scybalousia intestinigallinarum]|nr:hypothetical protein [Candidatus Scybalousia intestinigallinarum]
MKITVLYRYPLILLLAHFIYILYIPSIYSLPIIVLIPFNYLAINYGIRKPLQEKGISYRNNLAKLILFTIICISLILLLVKDSLISDPQIAWLVFTATDIIELFLMIPKKEKQKESMQENIDNYFKNKNQEK